MQFKLNALFHLKDKDGKYLGVMRITKISEDSVYAKLSPTEYCDEILEKMRKHELNVTKTGPESDLSNISADEISDLGVEFEGLDGRFTCRAFYVSANNLVTVSIDHIQEIK